MFKARVAFGAIADDIAEKKTTATGRPSVMFVGLENVAPKPPARPTAQPKSVMPKMGIRTILADGKQGRNQSTLLRRTRLIDSLGHEEVAELGDMDPEEGQLDDEEDEITQKL